MATDHGPWHQDPVAPLFVDASGSSSSHVEEPAGGRDLDGVARTSRYAIELSDVDRLKLQRRAAALTLPFRVVQRARLVLCAAEGMIDTRSHGAAAGPCAGRPRTAYSPGGRSPRSSRWRGTLPARHNRSLGCLSRTELHRLVIEQVMSSSPMRRRGGCTGSSTTAQATPANARSIGSSAPIPTFEWTFTRAKLDARLARLAGREPHLRRAA
jgi:hypothetical protein